MLSNQHQQLITNYSSLNANSWSNFFGFAVRLSEQWENLRCWNQSKENRRLLFIRKNVWMRLLWKFTNNCSSFFFNSITAQLCNEKVHCHFGCNWSMWGLMSYITAKPPPPHALPIWWLLQAGMIARFKPGMNRTWFFSVRISHQINVEFSKLHLLICTHLMRNLELWMLHFLSQVTHAHCTLHTLY